MNHTHHLLLVEDSVDDVALIRRAFMALNPSLVLHVASDGEEALAYLAGRDAYADRERHPIPCLVLLDIKLPRRSGNEVLAWIRKQPDLKRLPVVIMTSSRQAANINLAYDLGANSYIVKPLGLAALTEVIRGLNSYWFGINTQPDVEQCAAAAARTA